MPAKNSLINIFMSKLPASITKPICREYDWRKLEGPDRDVLKLRPGITGPATLKYRLEEEMIADYVGTVWKC